MIEMHALTKRFDDKLAVDELTLTIPPGELFAFLGPNGAGKTTTIKMMTGLLRPTGGRVAVCGHDVLEEPVAAKAALSYIPDQPYLYEKLSGREFMEFVGRMYAMSRAEVEARTRSLGERLGLLEFCDELSERYSHGMKQRVVIAAALLHHPRVLVVDEPMVGLDPKTSRTVKDILRELAEGGATVFMSTHTLHVAEEIADRIGIIDRGRLVAVGTLGELYERAGGPKGLEELFLELTAHEEEAPWPRA
jgi:ABC-2 type transport system ATP-binding protein